MAEPLKRIGDPNRPTVADAQLFLQNGNAGSTFAAGDFDRALKNVTEVRLFGVR